MSLYNPIRDKFSSLFENVVLGNLKFCFQLDIKLTIASMSRRLRTALCHSRELLGLKPYQYTFNPTSHFGFPDFKTNFISIQNTGFIKSAH